MVAGHYLTEGPDYELLWKQLEDRLLEMQKNASIACCTEKDYANLSRWQGIWGTFGTVFNTMQELKSASQTARSENGSASGEDPEAP